METVAEARCITKDITLNALVKRFPQLLGALHAFHLDCPWLGSDTLEEVAWHRGLAVEDVVGELNRLLFGRTSTC